MKNGFFHGYNESKNTGFVNFYWGLTVVLVKTFTGGYIKFFGFVLASRISKIVSTSEHVTAIFGFTFGLIDGSALFVYFSPHFSLNVFVNIFFKSRY